MIISVMTVAEYHGRAGEIQLLQSNMALVNLLHLITIIYSIHSEQSGVGELFFASPKAH